MEIPQEDIITYEPSRHPILFEFGDGEKDHDRCLIINKFTYFCLKTVKVDEIHTPINPFTRQPLPTYKKLVASEAISCNDNNTCEHPPEDPCKLIKHIEKLVRCCTLKGTWSFFGQRIGWGGQLSFRLNLEEMASCLHFELIRTTRSNTFRVGIKILRFDPETLTFTPLCNRGLMAVFTEDNGGGYWTMHVESSHPSVAPPSFQKKKLKIITSRYYGLCIFDEGDLGLDEMMENAATCLAQDIIAVDEIFGRHTMHLIPVLANAPSHVRKVFLESFVQVSGKTYKVYTDLVCRRLSTVARSCWLDDSSLLFLRGEVVFRDVQFAKCWDNRLFAELNASQLRTRGCDFGLLVSSITEAVDFSYLPLLSARHLAVVAEAIYARVQKHSNQLAGDPEFVELASKGCRDIFTAITSLSPLIVENIGLQMSLMSNEHLNEYLGAVGLREVERKSLLFNFVNSLFGGKQSVVSKLLQYAWTKCAATVLLLNLLCGTDERLVAVIHSFVTTPLRLLLKISDAEGDIGQLYKHDHPVLHKIIDVVRCEMGLCNCDSCI